MGCCCYYISGGSGEMGGGFCCFYIIFLRGRSAFVFCFVRFHYFFGGGEGGISCAVVFCIFWGQFVRSRLFSKSFTKTHVVVGIYIKINNCIYKNLKRIMFVSTPTIFWYHVYSSFDLIFLCI